MGLARIDREIQHHPPRSRCVVTNRGSWSTGEKLPTGVLLSRTFPYALAWQIEHNGPWLYELGETRTGAYLLLSGPTDQEHQWSTEVAEGTVFISVPASMVVARGGLDEAFAVLTDQRRAIRAVRAADRRLPVVFNDYMNTLMGNPTTEKLLPLIDAAAEVAPSTSASMRAGTRRVTGGTRSASGCPHPAASRAVSPRLSITSASAAWLPACGLNPRSSA